MGTSDDGENAQGGEIIANEVQAPTGSGIEGDVQGDSKRDSVQSKASNDSFASGESDHEVQGAGDAADTPLDLNSNKAQDTDENEAERRNSAGNIGALQPAAPIYSPGKSAHLSLVPDNGSTRSSHASVSTLSGSGEASGSANTSMTSARNSEAAQDAKSKHTSATDHEQEVPTSHAVQHETRPYSLAAPETPSASIPTGYAPPTPVSASVDDSKWRDSVAEGTTMSAMDTVALSDSTPGSAPLSPISEQGSINTRFQSVSFSEAGPSAPPVSSPLCQSYQDPSQNGLHQPLRSNSSSSGNNYDLITHHAQSLQAEMKEHPKRKRRSEMGSADLRASFAKMRDEAEHADSENGKRASTSVETDEQGQPIDWPLWSDIVSDYEGMAKTRPKELSKAIQDGIPPALRGMMWQLMSASKDPELEAVYSSLMRQPSSHEKAIIRDLNRTFPSHEYFHDGAGVGQNNLLNIMKAYSLYDEEVGYCQGMAFVAGPLLLNMPDEEAFCVLVRLMKSYDLRSQYIPDMPGLQLRLFQFDRLLEELLPAVFMHLLRQGIKSSMYASQWFLTLLAYRFPLELVCSVFDLIFAEGVEAIFRFALALMRRNEHSILQMEFEQVLDFLKTGLFEHYKMDLQEGQTDTGAPSYSSQTFVREALQVKITPMMLDQFAAEWTEHLRQQNAQNQEVEQLRAINKKLSNQVRGLETSLAQINEEHCELVKQVVATRLEKEELEDELVRVKMALAQESLLREEGRGSIASRSSFASFGSYGGPRTPEAPTRRDSQASRMSK